EFAQLGRLAPRAQVEEQRDGARHLPVVVEPAGRLEGGDFAHAIEGHRARLLLADEGLQGAAGGLLGHGVVARARVDEHSVDVEDDAADVAQRQGHAGSSARSAARKASFAGGAPMLTRNARSSPVLLETLRMRTPRRKRAAWRSFAGRFSCSKRMKLAPESCTAAPSSRSATATRSRSAITSRVRSATSSGRAISARAIIEVAALRLYGSCTLRNSAHSRPSPSMHPARRLAAASALEKVRKSTSRGWLASRGT